MARTADVEAAAEEDREDEEAETAVREVGEAGGRVEELLLPLVDFRGGVDG